MKGLLKVESLRVGSSTYERCGGTLELYQKGQRNPHLVMDFEEFKVITLPGMRGNGHSKYAFRAGCYLGFDEATIFENGRIEIKLPVITNGLGERYRRGLITFKNKLP